MDTITATISPSAGNVCAQVQTPEQVAHAQIEEKDVSTLRQELGDFTKDLVLNYNIAKNLL